MALRSRDRDRDLGNCSSICTKQSEKAQTSAKPIKQYIFWKSLQTVVHVHTPTKSAASCCEWDLASQLSRPRPRPWHQGLARPRPRPWQGLETETLVKWTRVLWSLETLVSRDHNTGKLWRRRRRRPITATTTTTRTQWCNATIRGPRHFLRSGPGPPDSKIKNLSSSGAPYQWGPASRRSSHPIVTPLQEQRRR